jgi:hypothetical protein
MTHDPDLLDTARAAAADILAEHAGIAPLVDLLAVAYMRGFTEAYRETVAELKRVPEAT